jgi:hypothetical protein
MNHMTVETNVKSAKYGESLRGTHTMYHIISNVLASIFVNLRQMQNILDC